MCRRYMDLLVEMGSVVGLRSAVEMGSVIETESVIELERLSAPAVDLKSQEMAYQTWPGAWLTWAKTYLLDWLGLLEQLIFAKAFVLAFLKLASARVASLVPWPAVSRLAQVAEAPLEQEDKTTGAATAPAHSGLEAGTRVPARFVPAVAWPVALGEPLDPAVGPGALVRFVPAVAWQMVLVEPLGPVVGPLMLVAPSAMARRCPAVAWQVALGELLDFV